MKIVRIPLPQASIVALSFAVFVAVFFLATTSTPARAAGVCRAVMVIDRSGSVGNANMNTLRNQIARLFEPTGLYSDNISLAFWSFSANTPTPNYDAPFNDFVSSRGHNSHFDSSLSTMNPSGSTNYEQGFGYNAGIKNPYISSIMDNADIIVFMTDGLPNTPAAANNPNQGADNNTYARNVARQAVLKLRQAGKIIVGGIVGAASPASLNYVINGSDNDSTNLFHISTTYNDLTQKLKQVIGDQCDALTPPTPPYSLVPSVTLSNTIVTAQGGADFSYHVTNTSTNTVSDSTGWAVRRVIVDRGQSVEPLLLGNDEYRDSYSCAILQSLVNNRGTCSDVESGERTFGPGRTDWISMVPLVVQDDWEPGRHVCYVLTLDKPTNNPQPRDRFSKAVCAVVGKRPSVQVWGGDLRVGRRFVDDSTPVTGQDTSYIAGSLTIKSSGMTYGSWAEYGVFSAGPVVGFASMAGLEGGYPSGLTNTQEFWSRLTFANAGQQYGMFTNDDLGVGTIPDVKSALLVGHSVVQNLNSVSTFDVNNPNIVSGIYHKENGSLSLSASTLAKGKTVIVYVPSGTVTITGNLNYDDGPYTDISQIPSLVIIAKNIVIQGSVDRVAAWLISDDAAGGTVTTCDDTGTLTIEICNRQLRIDGPVMARHLNLRRTAGSGSGADAANPAEIINLPASTYLWSQSEGRSDTRVQATSTVELPPYF